MALNIFFNLISTNLYSSEIARKAIIFSRTLRIVYPGLRIWGKGKEVIHLCVAALCVAMMFKL